MRRVVELSLYGLIVLAFGVDWFTDELALLPHAATFSIEALIVALLLCAVVQRRAWVRLPTDLPCAALFIVALVTVIVRGTDVVSMLAGFRSVFRFVAMYYALVMLQLPDRVWRNAFRVLLACLYVQIPIAAYQFGILGKIDDQVFGSLRSTGVLSVVTIAAIAIHAELTLRHGRMLWPLLASFGFFLLPAWGEAKGFYILFPLAAALVLFAIGRRSMRRAFAVGAVWLLFSGISLVVFSTIDGNSNLLAVVPRMGSVMARASLIGAGPSSIKGMNVEVPLTVDVQPVSPPASASAAEIPGSASAPKAVGIAPVTPVSAPGAIERTMPAQSSVVIPLSADSSAGGKSADNAEVALAASTWPRIQALKDALARIRLSMSTTVAGFGIGTRTFTRSDVETRSSALLYASPAASRLYELGVGGTALFWAMFAAVLLSWRRVRDVDSGLLRGAIVAFPGVLLMYAVAEFYTEILTDAAGLTFWLMAAAVVDRSLRARNEAAATTAADQLLVAV